MAGATVVLAQAKINLGLEVDERDVLGLHPIQTIFAELTLADELTIERADAWQFRVRGEATDCPAANDNLVWQAWALTKSLPAIGPNWQGVLTKRIPIAAGLGGGSSDAAAWIRYHTDRHPELAEGLWSQADRLGKDLPFFRSGGIQRASGYGDQLQPLSTPDFSPYVVLANPGWGLATKAVYDAFDTLPAQPRGALDGVAQALREGSVPDCIVNHLALAAERVRPDLKDFRAALMDWSGETSWWLTGSGATYYILIDDEEQARFVHRRVQGRAPWTCQAQVQPKRQEMGRG